MNLTFLGKTLKPGGLLVFFVLLILLNSCVTQHKVEYLQSKKSRTTEFANNTFQEYTLRPNDELYIQISSFDDASNFLSNTGSQNTDISNPFGASLQAHMVDKEGYLELPVVGKLMVKDKTIAQVKDLLKEALVNVLNQPIITVKMVNRYVSVLGEVKSPGHFPYSQEKMTIFDALSLAGDIGDYGNRHKVLLLRSDNGKTYQKTLNLAKTEILTSEYYFIQPNDIIYVKPLTSKLWSKRTTSVTLLLTITNVVAIFLLRN